MTAIALGQSSSVSNPVLSEFIRDGGYVVDPFRLQYQVLDATTDGKRLVPIVVYPNPDEPTERADVDLVDDRLALGWFVANWTPTVEVEADPDADPPIVGVDAEPTGRHLIRWFLTLIEDGAEQTWTREFEVLDGLPEGVQTGYCMVTELREEGVTLTQATDLKLILLINEASRYVEWATRRFFEPRRQAIAVDGRGGVLLMLGQPIVALDAVELVSPLVNDWTIQQIDYQVYNRHLDGGLASPDDRENPKIALLYYEQASWRLTGGIRWPSGKQNVRVTGVFGYTDADGSPAGCTPREIQRVTMALVWRNLLPLTHADRDDRMSRHLVTSETVRDQSITRKFAGDTPGGCTAFTGDSAIDNVLMRFRHPMPMGAA